MNFWERRRAAVEAETRAEEAALVQAERAEQEKALAETSDEELLAEFELPDPDTLGAEDDFKAFLAEGIPARLKTRALRRLWRVNPVLANLDGLLDYGEDFTDAATVVENMQTAYQVGKGMLKHVEELARQAELKDRAAEATEEDGQGGLDPDTAEVAETEGEETPSTLALGNATMKDDAPGTRDVSVASGEVSGDVSVDAKHPVASDEEVMMPPPSRRRMTFSFQNNAAPNNHS